MPCLPACLLQYDCVKCGYVLGPFAMNSEQEVKPSSCPSCASKGPFNVSWGGEGSERRDRGACLPAMQAPAGPVAVPAAAMDGGSGQCLTGACVENLPACRKMQPHLIFGPMHGGF